MVYLVLGAVFAAFLLFGSRKPLFKGDGWRIGAGVAAIAAFAAAAFTGARGEWGRTIVLVVLGVWTATSARQRPSAGPRAARSAPGGLSLSEARAILGVEAGASRSDIQAAYGRLIRLAHPDKGGTAGLAAQLNAARDRLLKA